MELPEVRYLPGVPLPLLAGEAHACPYLPGQTARELYALPLGIDAPVYQHLMNRGFRRAGSVFYRPDCPACQACRPLRVRVSDFQPTRSQRRVARRNADVAIKAGPPQTDTEHFELFRRYQAARHGGEMSNSQQEFDAFLGDSPLDTIEMAYRLDGRLIGVGILDVCPDVLSSVYFYFEPELAVRSLGVYSGICEIEEAWRRGLQYWYVGFHIADCDKMRYKARYAPHELLTREGVWRRQTTPSGDARDSIAND